jgi:hypothetical protein
VSKAPSWIGGSGLRAWHGGNLLPHAFSLNCGASCGMPFIKMSGSARLTGHQGGSLEAPGAAHSCCQRSEAAVASVLPAR